MVKGVAYTLESGQLMSLVEQKTDIAKDEAKISAAFSLLKPICSALLPQPNQPDLHALSDLVQNRVILPDDCLQSLLDYVLFPFRVLLKRSVAQETPLKNTAECLSVLDVLLSRNVTIERVETFLDLFGSLVLSLDQKDRFETVTVEVLKCLNELIICGNRHIPVLISQKYYPMLGQTVFTLVNFVKGGSASPLKIITLSIDCLNVLSNEGQPSSASVGSWPVSSTAFSFFIPGLSTAVMELCCKQVLTHHSVQIAALKLWCQVVMVTLGTDHDPVALKDMDVSPLCTMTNVAAWKKKTWDRLSIDGIRLIQQLSMHDHPTVREATGDCAYNLIVASEILESMPEAFKHACYEAVICLLADDVSAIATAAADRLKQLERNKTASDLNQGFVNFLELRFHSCCLQLPRLIRSDGFDLNRRKGLCLLNGCLKALGSRAGVLCLSEITLNKITTAFCQILEPAHQKIEIVAIELTQSSIYDDETAFSVSEWPDIPLKHLPCGSRERSLVLESLNFLAQNSDLNILIHHLLFQTRTQGLYDVESWYIIVELLSASSNLVSLDLVALLDYCCETFDETEFDLAPQDEIIDQDRLKLDRSVLLVHLCMKCMALCAAGMSRPTFEPYLMRILGRVMDYSESDHPPVIRLTRCLLHDLAVGLGFKDVRDFIRHYLDYLLNSLISQLLHLELYPRAPLVLKAVIQFGDERHLPILKTMCEELVRRLDINYENRCTAFLSALRTVLKVVASWNLTSSAPQLATTDHVDADNLIEEDEPLEDLETMEDPVKKPASPDYVQMTVQILHRTKHLMSVKQLHLRLMSLEILSFGLQLLAPWTDDLLPMIHQNWSGLAVRITCGHESPVIKREAYKVVCQTASLSGTFVYRKVFDDVWTSVRHILIQLASRSKGSGRFYHKSADYRLQETILGGLKELFENIDIMERNLAEVLPTVVPYLSSEQPAKLSKEAAEVIQYLFGRFPNADVQEKTLIEQRLLA